METVALDGARETMTLGDAGNVHRLGIGEVGCAEFLANRPGFEISDIKFSEVFTNSDVSLLEMADFCLVGTLFLLETKADLDSSVAVLLFCLMANDHARTGSSGTVNSPSSITLHVTETVLARD